jgi:threonine dehydrogenase-like Zn-dependent dehydrogenase
VEAAASEHHVARLGPLEVEMLVAVPREPDTTVDLDAFARDEDRGLADEALLRERSLRYLFPDISTQAHLEHTVRLAATGRVRLKETITHVLSGIESVPKAFEITANKGKFQAINPAQVMMERQT